MRSRIELLWLLNQEGRLGDQEKAAEQWKLIVMPLRPGIKALLKPENFEEGRSPICRTLALGSQQRRLLKSVELDEDS